MLKEFRFRMSWFTYLIPLLISNKHLLQVMIPFVFLLFLSAQQTLHLQRAQDYFFSYTSTQFIHSIVIQVVVFSSPSKVEILFYSLNSRFSNIPMLNE